MERRSTNDIGYTHHQGDITAGVGSSYGVRLSGGSTEGIVEAVGDDTNVNLRLRPQGTTGGLLLGSTANSTSAILGVQKYRIDFTIADLSSGPAQTESTITVAGLSTTAVLMFTPRSVTSALYAYGVKCSTAAELKLNQINTGPSSIGTAATTNSGILLEFRF